MVRTDKVYIRTKGKIGSYKEGDEVVAEWRDFLGIYCTKNCYHLFSNLREVSDTKGKTEIKWV